MEGKYPRLQQTKDCFSTYISYLSTIILKSMNKFFYTIAIIMTIAISSFGQIQIINFEDTTYKKCISVDTISNPNNIWQVGKPQKTKFTTALSIPNAIVTDTLNYYPCNDTSSFILTHNVLLNGNGSNYWGSFFNGSYYVNSDTLNDIGTIEVSSNKNHTWINLLTSTYFQIYNKPTLNGNSNGWQYFSIYIESYPLQAWWGDTIYLRFTFASDSIQTNKDGLMFDDIQIIDYGEGIEEFGIGLINSKAFPNPVNDNLIIEFENTTNSSFDIILLNNTGKAVRTISDCKQSSVSINTKELSSGIYYYKLINRIDKKNAFGKFVKQ